MSRHLLTLIALGVEVALLALAVAQVTAETRWRRRYARQPHRPDHPAGNPIDTPDIPEGPDVPPHKTRRATPA